MRWCWDGGKGRDSHGADGSVQGGSAVKPEPAKPDQDGAEEDKGRVVRFAVGLVADGLALAEDEGVGQTCPAAGDVHWPATGEVERWEVVEPAVGVPGPAGDWTVDYRRPAKAKDQGRQDTTAFEGAADDDLHRAGAEEQLVEAEDDLGDVRATGGWCSGDVHEAEVFEVADEGVGGAAVGQAVAPEHPLEGCDGCDHDGLEEQAQGALAAR